MILGVFADLALTNELLAINKGVSICGVCFVDSVSCLFKAIIGNNIDRPNLDIEHECNRILKKKYANTDKLRSLFTLSEMFSNNSLNTL